MVLPEGSGKWVGKWEGKGSALSSEVGKRSCSSRQGVVVGEYSALDFPMAAEFRDDDASEDILKGITEDF